MAQVKVKTDELEEKSLKQKEEREMVTALQEREKKNVAFCEYYEGCERFDLSLMIDATNICQLRCPYCYFGEKGHQKMDVNKVMAAAKNLLSIFEPKLDGINFHYMGGEPLLAWEEILALDITARRFFEEKGVKFTWSLTSNLIALDEKKTEHMIREKAGIHCSIDGPARIHDKNRPYADGKPSFADVVKSIPLALQITPNDTARVTVCPEDAKSLPEIAETVLALGFQTVGLFPAYNMEWNRKTIEEWAKAIATAYKRIRDSYQDRKKINTIIPQKGQGIDRFTYCGAGKGLWAISVDGKLYFCHRHTNIPEFEIIDASQATPKEIRTAIEQSILPPSCEQISELCLTCLAKDYCNGGCWLDNLLMNGNSMIPNLIQCEMMQATVVTLGEFISKEAQAPKSCIICDETGGGGLCFPIHICCLGCMGCKECYGCVKDTRSPD